MSPGSALPPLVLASGSPRRRDLLALLGLPFKVETKLPFRELPERENTVFSPSEFVWYNAVGKALAAAVLHPGRQVVAADTAVALEGRLFGKPRTRAEADATLAALSGRGHRVLTAVVVIDPEGTLRGGVEQTEVVFRRLDPALRRRYLAAVSVLDKAGGYAVQEHGDWLIERIEGSLSNVIGLPLETLARLLHPQVET
jgi:septum formation protein